MTAIKRLVVVLPSLVDAGGASHLVPSLFRATYSVVARAFSSIDDDGTLKEDEDGTGGVSSSASSLALAPHLVVVWNTVAAVGYLRLRDRDRVVLLRNGCFDDATEVNAEGPIVATNG